MLVSYVLQRESWISYDWCGGNERADKQQQSRVKGECFHDGYYRRKKASRTYRQRFSGGDQVSNLYALNINPGSENSDSMSLCL
jgi:hypothetical protein